MSKLVAWLSISVLVSINLVTVCRVRLIIGCVTLLVDKPSWYITSHLCQLSLPSLWGRLVLAFLAGVRWGVGWQVTLCDPI